MTAIESPANCAERLVEICSKLGAPHSISRFRVGGMDESLSPAAPFSIGEIYPELGVMRLFHIGICFRMKWKFGLAYQSLTRTRLTINPVRIGPPHLRFKETGIMHPNGSRFVAETSHCHSEYPHKGKLVNLRHTAFSAVLTGE